jgi:hypothetical protein
MDSIKFSTQVERLGVVETGRVVAGRMTRREFQASRSISSTARCYGISLLLNWRRSFCTEPDGAAGQKSGFVPAMVVVWWWIRIHQFPPYQRAAAW